MKKVMILISASMLIFASCRETTETREVIREVPADNTVREVKVETKTIEREGALERASKKVDRKINDKIDKAIDDID